MATKQWDSIYQDRHDVIECTITCRPRLQLKLSLLHKVVCCRSYPLLTSFALIQIMVTKLIRRYRLLNPESLGVIIIKIIKCNFLSIQNSCRVHTSQKHSFEDCLITPSLENPQALWMQGN